MTSVAMRTTSVPTLSAGQPAGVRQRRQQRHHRITLRLMPGRVLSGAGSHCFSRSHDHGVLDHWLADATACRGSLHAHGPRGLCVTAHASCSAPWGSVQSWSRSRRAATGQAAGPADAPPPPRWGCPAPATTMKHFFFQPHAGLGAVTCRSGCVRPSAGHRRGECRSIPQKAGTPTFAAAARTSAASVSRPSKNTSAAPCSALSTSACVMSSGCSSAPAVCMQVRVPPGGYAPMLSRLQQCNGQEAACVLGAGGVCSRISAWC